MHAVALLSIPRHQRCLIIISKLDNGGLVVETKQEGYLLSINQACCFHSLNIRRPVAFNIRSKPKDPIKTRETFLLADSKEVKGGHTVLSLEGAQAYSVLIH